MREFSRAAEKCHISQPGISKAIRELEEECGVALFQRNRNNIQITRRGRILLEHARQFQNHYRNLCQVVRTLGTGKALIRIGIATMRGNTIFPPDPRGFPEKPSPDHHRNRGRNHQCAL